MNFYLHVISRVILIKTYTPLKESIFLAKKASLPAQIVPFHADK